jgi:hypothetical protein
MAPPQGYEPVTVTMTVYAYGGPPPPDWTPSDSMHHRVHQDPSTVTNTVTATSISVHVIGTPTPPMFEMGDPSATPVISPTPYAQNNATGTPTHGPPKYVLTAAGAIVSVIGILIMVLLFIFLCRRSKRRKNRMRDNRDSIEEQQMVGTMSSSDTLNSVRAYRPEPLAIPSLGYHSSSSTFTSQSPRSPHHPPNPQHPQAPQHPQIPQQQQIQVTPPPPVLLSTTVNHSYLTGIDTSDNISVHQQPTTITHDDMDEPPPPYRPRSLAPPSRQNSGQIANGMLPNYQPGQMRIPVTESSSSNPFDDPDNETNDYSSSIWCRNSRECPQPHPRASVGLSRMSSVSDVENEEPTATHSTI